MVLRVSNASMTRSIINEINRSFSRMNVQRLRVSSGREINAYADDPRGIGLLRRFDALQANNAQYLRNAGAARSFLEAADSTMQDMATGLVDLRQVVLQQLGPLADAEGRSAATEAVRGLRDMMLSFANGQVEDSYLFAGFSTDRAPFALVGDEVSYTGDSGIQYAQVGSSLQLPVNVPGSVFMGTQTASLAGRAELEPRVRPSTLLADLNGGTGVNLGTIEIRSGASTPTQVDLSGATTVQDVLDAINASGAGVTAAIGVDESGLVITGPDPLGVAEVDDGTTAADLGLLGTSVSTTLTGASIHPPLSSSTDFTEMRSLDGLLPLGVLRFHIGNAVTDVDLSGASNLSDVRDSIQALIPDMDLRVSDAGIELELGRPEPFSVESPTDDATAVALGLQGEASPARLFDLFADILTGLESDDDEMLRQALVELEDVHATVLSAIVRVGARQQTLDQTEAMLRDRSEDMRLQRSRVEDVDLVDAATRLSFAETSYQAALASSANIFQMSLLNFM